MNVEYDTSIDVWHRLDSYEFFFFDMWAGGKENEEE